MKFSFFHLMPFTGVEIVSPDWPTPNRLFAEQCGFDWVGCNEHHFSPYGLMANCTGGLGEVALRTDIEAGNRRMLAHYAAEDGKDEALLKNLSRIEKVTLIVHGTEDRIIGKESMQLLKSRLRRSFLVYVWDAAHHIEVDQPERMLAVVQSFLERSDAFMVNYA